MHDVITSGRYDDINTFFDGFQAKMGVFMVGLGLSLNFIWDTMTT